MKNRISSALQFFGAIAFFAVIAASAQPYAPPFTQQIPQVQSINSNDFFQDIVAGNPQPNNFYASAAQIGTYSQTLVGGNAENSIVAGDASQNLFDRTTTVALASPAAVAFTADSWVAWGGTSTPVTVSQSTTAPSNFLDAYQVVKPSGAGVVQVCFAPQPIETTNAVRYQGLTAELDFHAEAMSGFSAANSNLAAYILTGTGTNEGASNGAFSINAGGGSSTPWTNATLFGGTGGFQIPLTTAYNRYTIAVPVPVSTAGSAVTEIMAAFCWTPVGTGTSTDGFRITGVQFVPNAALNAVAGAAGAIVGANDVRAKSFVRRPMALEAYNQARFLPVVVAESGTSGFTEGQGTWASGTTCSVPMQLRAVPFKTPTITNTLTASTFTLIGTGSTTATVLSTPFSAATTGGGTNVFDVTFTSTTATGTAGTGCSYRSAAGGGLLIGSAELL